MYVLYFYNYISICTISIYFVCVHNYKIQYTTPPGGILMVFLHVKVHQVEVIFYKIVVARKYIQILFDEVRPPHHTPPTHHTKKISQKNGRNGEMVKCRPKISMKI